MSAREELASLPLHERIAAVIAHAEITQETFAQRIGVGRPKVNNWVNGRGGPGRENAQKLAAVASEIYGEELPPDLFLSTRVRPVDETLAEINRTAQELRAALEDLTSLLALQRQLVETMSRIATQLEQREDPGADQ